MELAALQKSIQENAAWITAVERYQRNVLREIEKQRANIKTIKNYVAEQDGFLIDYGPNNQKFVAKPKKHRKGQHKERNPMLKGIYGDDLANDGNVLSIYDKMGKVIPILSKNKVPRIEIPTNGKNTTIESGAQ